LIHRSAAARWLLPGVVAVASLLAGARPALAQLRTCVTVEGAKEATEVLARLVRSEVDRHPTHRAATDGCQAYLTVELIDLGVREGEGRWLTGRINTQVPHREKIGPDGQVAAVERLLTIVLANDPFVLRDPNATSWLRRQQRALEVRSHLRVGVEVYELASWMGGSLATLPGLAVSVRREVSEFFIGVRLAGATQSDGARGQLQLRAQVDAQLEAAVYARPSANVSLFVSGLLGIAHQRFQGPAPFDGPGAIGDATSTGVSVGARAGVEVLRISDVRGLAFLELQAPTFVSADPDHGVVDAWIPSASLGVGVLF
jgi:hypothetical protein